MSYIGTDDDCSSFVGGSSRRNRQAAHFNPYASQHQRSPMLPTSHGCTCKRRPCLCGTNDDGAPTNGGDSTRHAVAADELWDTGTCLTGATSEANYSNEDLVRATKYGGKSLFDDRRRLSSSTSKNGGASSVHMRCSRYVGRLLTVTIGAIAYLSPLIMLALPKALPSIRRRSSWANSTTRAWTTSTCSADCEGQLIAFAFKHVILLVAVFMLFVRRSVANMPRLNVARAAILALLFLLTFSYWLFYGVRIVERRVYNYSTIVAFSTALVDALLFMHYLAVILLELRGLRPDFRVHVTRSPDGVSRCYDLAALSLQQAAVHILSQYYKGDMGVYNAFLDRLPTSSMARMRMSKRDGGGSAASDGGGGDLKMYTIDGGCPGEVTDKNTQAALMVAAARKRESSQHNERFYDEQDYERRVRKRKCRLVQSTEDAFAHVRRLAEQTGPCQPMSAHEAAQAVFPAFARSLQKYLRVTRQQPRHTADQVVRHLTTCLAYDVSPKAFLERFIGPFPTHDSWQSECKWSIVGESMASSAIAHGDTFVLRCHSQGPDATVQLMCQITQLPFFNLTEQPYAMHDNNFVLRLNSETSV